MSALAVYLRQKSREAFQSEQDTMQSKSSRTESSGREGEEQFERYQQVSHRHVSKSGTARFY